MRREAGSRASVSRQGELECKQRTDTDGRGEAMARSRAVSAGSSGGPSSRFVRWIVHHDESWLFVAIYLGLAVGLSVFVSLFWLLVGGAFHLLLEFVRQAHYHRGAGRVLLHSFWEIKMDLGLILLALSVVLYLEVVMGVLGLQSAARAAAVGRMTNTGVRAGTRAAQAGTRAAQAGARAAGGTSSAMEQWVRGFVLTVDDIARVLYAVFLIRRSRKQSLTQRAEAAAVTDAGERTAVGEAAPARAAAPELEIVDAAAEAGGGTRAETPTGENETRDTWRTADEDAGGARPQAPLTEAAGDAPQSMAAETEAHECADAPHERTRDPNACAEASHEPAETPNESPDAPEREAAQSADTEQAAELEPPLRAGTEACSAGDTGRRAGSADARTAPRSSWRGAWAVSDLVGVLMVAVGLFLLSAAPYLTGHEWGTAVMTIADELKPLSGLE